MQSIKTLLIFFLISIAGCNNQTAQKAMEKSQSTLKYSNGVNSYDEWKTELPGYFALSEDLKLRIPSQYQQFWIQRDKIPRTEEGMKKRKNAGSLIGFDFFLPNFDGYTRANHDINFNPDKVEVIVEARGLGEEKYGAAGNYPRNMYTRTLKYENVEIDSSIGSEHGLECFVLKNKTLEDGAKNITCYRINSDDPGEMIHLSAIWPPYPNWVQFPSVQASYFSPRHGGVYIIWRTHMKNFSEWKKIDQQIWAWLKEWEIK